MSLTRLYLTIGFVLLVVLAIGFKIAADIPEGAARIWGAVQHRLLRGAAEQTSGRLARLQEQLVEWAARPDLMRPPTDGASSSATAWEGVWEQRLEAVEAEQLGRWYIEHYDRDGAVVMERTASQPPAQSLVGAAERAVLLRWAGRSLRDQVRAEVVRLDLPLDPSGDRYCRLCAPVWRETEGVETFDGVLCLWFPADPFLRQFLTEIVRLPLPESYSFVLSQESDGLGAAPMPELLSHSTEPHWVNATEPRGRRLVAELARSRLLAGSVRNFAIVTVPGADGRRRWEVVSAAEVRFNASRTWIYCLSTPYDVAVRDVNAQRWMLGVLGAITLLTLATGAGLLYQQRVRLEQEQRRELSSVQRDYHDLFAHNPTSMLVFDDEGTLIDCNIGAVGLLGVAKPAALHRRFDRLFDAAAATPLWDGLTGQGTLYAHDVTLLRGADRSPVLVEVHGKRVGDRWIVMLQDIEQRRELERQIVRLRNMDSMGSLAATLAHDFNNVLGQIQILVSNMRVDARPGSDLAEDLTIIEGKVKDASRMVRSLLAFREDVVAERPVDVRPVLRAYAAQCHATLPTGIAAEFELPETLDAVWISPHALRRLLDNLIGNAVDAMPGGGRIRIRAGVVSLKTGDVDGQLPAGRYTTVEVADNGKGMSPETLDTIFQPFYSTKPDQKGSGLGLWTVYKIARKVGGVVTVRSRLGHGTAFTLYLATARPGREPFPDPRTLDFASTVG